MTYKSELRIQSSGGASWPEHRHGVRNWHWAWSTHGGIDPTKDAAHKGIYRANPLTLAQTKAKVAYTATVAANRKAEAAKAKAKAKAPRKARKAKAIAASVEEAIDLVNSES